MDKDLLKKTVIFRGMNDNELNTALSALKSTEKEFLKDEVILYAGSTTDMMGLVLEGSVRIESNDSVGEQDPSESCRKRAGICRDICYGQR